MHGADIACDVVGIEIFLAPRCCFWAASDRCAEDHPLTDALEACVSRRPFARLQRLFSFENHRGKVNAPGLSLRRNPEAGAQLVRLRTRSSRALSRGGDCHDSAPVAGSLTLELSNFQRLSLPVGISSLQISALDRGEFEKLALRSARFPIAPRERNVLLLTPADHRSRPATDRFSLLFLRTSWNRSHLALKWISGQSLKYYFPLDFSLSESAR